MIQTMKKVFAVLLTVAMLLGTIPTFAATVTEGDNGKTVYFTFDFYNEEESAKVTEVAANENFYVYVNFFGNPSVADDSIQGYNLLIEYDAAKVSFPYGDESFLGVLNTPLQLTTTYGPGVALVQGVANGGIKKGFNIATSGTLFKLLLTATSNLTEADLKAISLTKTTGVVGKEDTYAIDGNIPAGNFTVVQVPAIAVGEVEGEIYTDTTADQIKEMIQSFSFIDVSGNVTEYTNSDSEWADLTVALPTAGLKVGKNTLTASYDGYTCEFKVEVLDRVESIAVTTPPTNTTYTAFEEFDKTGMVVTATYESGATKDVTADCVVDTVTALEVEDTSWTITYNGKTTTQAITVNPLEIEKPVASDADLTYTGATQNFAYSTAANETYVLVSGETSGKDAKTYNATATLKDKNNTVWANGTGTTDIQLSWTIEKAEIISGLAEMTKKYTTTYAELPTEANITGVNSESVTATIYWYTDAAYEVVASGASQIAASYTGAGQTATLYYKATGMNNYADYKGSVIVNITDKDAAIIDWKTLPAGLTKSGENIVGTYSKEVYALSRHMFEAKAEDGSSLGTPANFLIAKNGTDVDAIQDAGTYTVTVSYEDKDYKALEEFTVVISPKSIEGLDVLLRIADGSPVGTNSLRYASAIYSGSVITPVIVGVDGLTEADYEVDSEAQNATLSAKNVGEGAYLIPIKGKGNYTGTIYGYWEIAPAEITPAGAVIANKVYNGNVDDASVETVTFTGLKGEDNLIKGVDYEIVSAVYADKNVGENVTVNVTVALKNTVKNYALKTATVAANGKITKAPSPSISAPTVQTLLSSSVVADAKEYTFDIAGILSGVPGDAGTVSYSVKEQGTYAAATVEDSSLKLNVAEAKEAGVTDSVVITVSSTNYENKDVTVNFEFKNKTSVEITLNDVNAVYDGEEHAVFGSYANQPQSGYTWTYQYVGIEGTVYPASNVAPVNAGKYSVTAKYEDNTPDSENPEIPGHVGEKSAIITISKKSLTIADGNVAVTKQYDETTGAGTLTGALALAGIVGEDEVLVDMTSATVSEYSAATVGTYTVEIGGLALSGADKENYSIPETYSFSNAKITKQLQSAVTINGSNENISVVYGDEIELVIGGGNGEGAYTLTSSDNSILKLNAKNENTWEAEILKAGTVTLVASKLGDDNYEAATNLEISFEIEPKTIVEGDFTIDLADKVFTGSEIKPDVTSEKLVAATDYDVAYSGNVNVGTATITITGKDNFKGDVSKTFTITAKAFDETEFTVSGLAESYTYTGAEIKPLVNVAWGNIVLSADTDYDVTYENNTNAGEATVILTGKGNYSGTLAETYTINPVSYTGSVTISASEEPVAENTVLTANAHAGGELAYQWKRNGENIENATNSTYTVTTEDAEAEISVVVTSTGNYVGEVESAAVIVGKSVLTGTVSISGTTEINAVIDGVPEDSYTIVWLRDNNVIADATGTTYIVSSNDKGCDISVKLIATGDVYTGEIVSNSISVPAEAPSFASNPTATAKNASVEVSFAANANGAQIMNYEIIVDGNVIATIDGNQTSYLITGLVNNTQYEIKVVAINSVGRTESEIVTATPFVRTNHGGGSVVSSNKVNFGTTTGGKITTNVKNATAGSTVVINVTPDEGYKLSEVIVRDKNGNVIPVTIDGLRCTFKMPKTAVTIEPVFVEEEKPVEDPDVKPGTTEFGDVENTAYYYDAVKWAVEKGITSGTDENAFSPNGECSRAQMVTFLWRAAGSPKMDDFSNPFADIDKNAYYYDAVMWAVKNGMTLGVSETEFAPDNQVTRAQSVTFLWRFAGEPSTSEENSFTDVNNDTYYNGAVSWAAIENVTNGLTESSFGPDAVCVRAQIVTFIYRYFVK